MRGPYKTATRGMTPEERKAWFIANPDNQRDPYVTASNTRHTGIAGALGSHYVRKRKPSCEWYKQATFRGNEWGL